MYNERDSLTSRYNTPVKMDLEVMTMKKYFPLLRSLELEPHHQMQFNIITRTSLFLGGGGEAGS